MLRIAWLIDKVVSCYPRVPDKVFRKFGPKPNDPVLEVLVFEEGGVGGDVVGVPAGVLTPGEGVEVENGVDLVFGALFLVKEEDRKGKGKKERGKESRRNETG